MSDEIVLTVNGKPHTVQASSDTPLLYILRNELRLVGPHFGCGEEKCGACKAFAGATKQLNSTYYQPFHAYASIGPSCAVADVNGDQVTVWASTPGPYPLSGALAQLLNLPVENIHLIFMEGAGSYGQNGADDAAADAVILSQAVGRPVRVQWTRADEFVWEPKSPAMVMEVYGRLDAQGNVVAWDYHVWSPSHVARARFAGQLLTAQLLSGQPAPQSRFSFGAERSDELYFSGSTRDRPLSS
jgi:nicotinate dehydrogenase subunit B